MNRPQLYQQLLHNESQLRALWRCEGLEHFVHLMADFLHWPELEFQQLLIFLHEQNQQPLQPDLELFSRCWLPYAYKRAGQQLLWIPAFQKPEQPFLEDDLVIWRQSLLAQLILPVTQLQPLLAQMQNLPAMQPQLLIFHWSRCGSTLVSGCLMLEPELKVLSESMLISDVLQDSELSADQKQNRLVEELPSGTITAFDDSDSLYGITLGYQLHPYFAVEMGYQDLGAASAQLSGDSLTPEQYHELVKAVSPVLVDGWTAAARFALWQNDVWNVEVPVGLFRWDSEIESSRGNSTLYSKTNGTDWFLGVQLNYSLSDNLKFGLGYQQLELEANDVSSWLLSVRYEF